MLLPNVPQMAVNRRVEMMSAPSHQSASRISAMWKAHKAQVIQTALAKSPCPDTDMLKLVEMEVESFFQPDRNIALRASRSLPPLTKPQQAD